LNFISYLFLSHTLIILVSRKLYQIAGIVCGFALIDFGFNFIAIGLPGAREMTSQFIGANLLIGGSAVVFISLFFLLRPSEFSFQQPAPESGTAPDVGVETVVEEQTPPQFRFYKNIEYVGYFLTALGLIAAADLVLQVFIFQIYNEIRWWIEILLVVFGVLSYAIFGSLGRIGAEEERALSVVKPGMTPVRGVETEVPLVESTVPMPEALELRLEQFSLSPSGEYEHKLADYVYDMVSVQAEMINVWRENRTGMRSVYLAGPYELTTELLQEHAKLGESIKIGILSISPESMRGLLDLQKELQTQASS
jgi:hypothetical protein